MIRKLWTGAILGIVILLIDDAYTFPDDMITERAVRKIIRRKSA